jgi:hypothetical protein
MSLQTEFVQGQMRDFSKHIGFGVEFGKATGSAPKGPRPVNTSDK